MDDNTNWTPFGDDNKLGITDKDLVNQYEAKGLIIAELFVFELDENIIISTNLILQIHRIAFFELYDWAGKWRTTDVRVGKLIPPTSTKVLNLMYQFIDNLNFKINSVSNINDRINCLVYAHYEFVKIHPFNNGNGRTGRLLMNLIGLKLGYKPISLYHRKGESRKIYIEAMQKADSGDFSYLINLVTKELSSF